MQYWHVNLGIKQTSSNWTYNPFNKRETMHSARNLSGSREIMVIGEECIITTLVVQHNP